MATRSSLPQGLTFGSPELQLHGWSCGEAKPQNSGLGRFVSGETARILVSLPDFFLLNPKIWYTEKLWPHFFASQGGDWKYTFQFKMTFSGFSRRGDFFLGESAILVGGWTNPFEKYSSKWIISPGIRVENIKCLKPPPRIWFPENATVFLNPSASPVFESRIIVPQWMIPSLVGSTGDKACRYPTGSPVEIPNGLGPIRIGNRS